MPVPKKHDTRSKVGKRRSQKKLKKQNLTVCPSCQAPRFPHRACGFCGVYKSVKAK